MLQSQLFTKTRRQGPKDEVSKNANLLIRGGFIHKEIAGVYSYLPLGLRVLNKICDVIRAEMDTIGGQEVSLASLQNKESWEKTDRWSDEVIDVWFKTKLKNDTELGFATTHEEPLTVLMKDHIHSYRDLPTYVYQFQTKFRNEIRVKSGIIRGREFLMKDLYSFSKDEKEHQIFYEKVKKAYKRVFDYLGIGEKTYVTFASGGTFSKYSHEFQTLTSAGEDSIFVCEKCEKHGKKIAINKEIINKKKVCPDPGCGGETFREEKAVEVGNIFNLGTKFSDAFDLFYLDERGEKKKIIMGSYGIGPGRVMGTIVEIFSDDQGIAWPKSVAPFDVHLIEVGSEKTEVKKEAEKIYKALSAKGVEVLYDDRDARAGEKFADADLLGIPTRIILSAKTLADKKAEVKNRTAKEPNLVSLKTLATEEFLKSLKKC